MSLELPIVFGTDGVRGPAGTWPIDARGAERIGCAVALWAGARRDIVIGRDTRRSGPDLVEAFAAGVVRGGANARHLGILPTAGVSTAILAHGAAAGAMITASHNPWTDNGIKLMGPDGKKLLATQEIGALLGKEATASAGTSSALSDPARSWSDALPRVDLGGLRIWLDCAHGSAHELAPKALEERGARVERIGCQPSGENINEGVGALHPPSPRRVREAGCDLAICLDGDADRVLLVDPRYGTLDGDDFLWILAGKTDTTVVGTVMSNGGLEAALGARLIRAKVGDRHVAEQMALHGAPFGAEPSGHVLFADGMPTGDGLYAALRLLDFLATEHEARISIGEACQGWTRWKQAKRNLGFTGERRDLEKLESIGRARDRGARVVVRYSGTEPLLRIMVEGLGVGVDSPESWVDRIATEFLQS